MEELHFDDTPRFYAKCGHCPSMQVDEGGFEAYCDDPRNREPFLVRGDNPPPKYCPLFDGVLVPCLTVTRLRISGNTLYIEEIDIDLSDDDFGRWC